MNTFIPGIVVVGMVSIATFIGGYLAGKYIEKARTAWGLFLAYAVSAVGLAAMISSGAVLLFILWV